MHLSCQCPYFPYARCTCVHINTHAKCVLMYFLVTHYCNSTPWNVLAKIIRNTLFQQAFVCMLKDSELESKQIKALEN